MIDMFRDIVDHTSLNKKAVSFLAERIDGCSFCLINESGEDVFHIGDVQAVLTYIQSHLQKIWGTNEVLQETFICFFVKKLRLILAVQTNKEKRNPDDLIILLKLVQTTLELFFAKEILNEERELIKVRSNQFDRQVNVLTEKKQQLLEENRSLFEHARKQQAEYSEKLKAEIDEQTTELQIKNSQLRKAARKNAEMAKIARSSSEAKSSFLATMSHEIRTPMNGIIGMVEILKDTRLTLEQMELTNSLGQSADALLAILNDILDYSKIEAGKLDFEVIDFNLREVLEEVGDLLSYKAVEKGVELICMIENDVQVHLKGDPGRLRQIILNLAGNSVKFIEEGQIVIGASKLNETEDQLEVRFSVEDTGIGIPEERIGELFNSFTQADASTTRKYGGTGLGLAISKQLVEMMGGKISAKSKLGEGTEFIFTGLFEKQTTGIAEKEKYDHLKDRKILVVDDNRINRDVFNHYLTYCECRVAEAENGKEALEMLIDSAQKNEPFDVVVADMQMPEMTGEELCIAIKADDTLKPMKLVVASSVAQRGDSEKMKTLGVSAFLPKPVKKKKLYDTLNRLFITSNLVNHDDETDSGPVDNVVVTDLVSSRQLKILLAEDNKINQTVAKRMLINMGHLVEIARNGVEAVDAYKTGRYDLILMDGQMPEMDGIEAAGVIRNLENEKSPKDNQRRTPIIAVTANAMTGDRERFIESGMDDYLSKPIKKADLIKVIHRNIT